jgi:hypothetical protein
MSHRSNFEALSYNLADDKTLTLAAGERAPQPFERSVLEAFERIRIAFTVSF